MLRRTCTHRHTLSICTVRDSASTMNRIANLLDLLNSTTPNKNNKNNKYERNQMNNHIRNRSDSQYREQTKTKKNNNILFSASLFYLCCFFLCRLFTHNDANALCCAYSMYHAFDECKRIIQLCQDLCSNIPQSPQRIV